MTPVIEIAPFQGKLKPSKPNSLAGTIKDDPEFQRFVEYLERTTEERKIAREAREAQEAEKNTSTPGKIVAVPGTGPMIGVHTVTDLPPLPQTMLKSQDDKKEGKEKKEKKEKKKSDSENSKEKERKKDEKPKKKQNSDDQKANRREKSKKEDDKKEGLPKANTMASRLAAAIPAGEIKIKPRPTVKQYKRNRISEKASWYSRSSPSFDQEWPTTISAGEALRAARMDEVIESEVQGESIPTENIPKFPKHSETEDTTAFVPSVPRPEIKIKPTDKSRTGSKKPRKPKGKEPGNGTVEGPSKQNGAKAEPSSASVKAPVRTSTPPTAPKGPSGPPKVPRARPPRKHKTSTVDGAPSGPSSLNQRPQSGSGTGHPAGGASGQDKPSAPRKPRQPRKPRKEGANGRPPASSGTGGPPPTGPASSSK